MELTLNEKRENITSLELLEKINQFREQVEGKNELLHKDLLKIIRDEFEEEINERKFSPVKYKDKKGEERPMFILTFNQAKQVLVRESKKVRKMVIKYIETLENALKQSQLLHEIEYELKNNKILLENYKKELLDKIILGNSTPNDFNNNLFKNDNRKLVACEVTNRCRYNARGNKVQTITLEFETEHFDYLESVRSLFKL